MNKEDFNRWSINALGCMQRCGEQFRRRYIEKERVPSGIKAKRGIAVHKIASETHKLQMQIKGTWVGEEKSTLTEEPGTEESVEEARDVAATVFDMEMKGGYSLTPDDIAVGATEAIANEKDAAVDLAGLYVGEVAQPVNPIAVERRIEVKPKDSDISVIGYIDLVEGTPEGAVIRDLKTGERAPYADAANNSGQLTMYSMIHKAETGSLPIASKLVHLIRTPKKGELKSIIQLTHRDENDVNMLVRRINVAVDAVKKGVFVPADPGTPGSPCSWCDYRNDCVYVKQKVSIAL